MAAHAPLKIGVLLISEGVQLLDLGGVDLFGSITSEYLAACRYPPHIVAKGLHAEFHYIVEEGEKPFKLTSGMTVVATDTIATAPKLDILIIPGPDPSYVPSAAVQKYIRESHDSVTTAMLIVCTGVLPVAHSGLLGGGAATGPRGLLPMLAAQFPDVKWEEKRWLKQGKLWTSGGITNGMDMVAAFLREFWDAEVVELTLAAADVGGRGQEYPST